MAPVGLVIAKLGIQATASSDSVRGVLCLKISLPKEGENRQGLRWPLFACESPSLERKAFRSTTHHQTATPIPLLSSPTLHPLPLPQTASSTPSPFLKTASTLLSLPPPSSYPPQSHSSLGGKPFLDVSSTTGQVSVVIDPVVSGTMGRSGHRRNESIGGRKDWLIIIEFEMNCQTVEEGLFKVVLPLPKCLDNVIRFQILPPSASSSTMGEVSILTEPKMLPLPPSAFASPQKAKASVKRVRQSVVVGREEGWEDGEDFHPDDREESSESEVEESSDESEGGGSWLEGRFQSTETLRLEWTFNSQSSSLPPALLHIRPQWSATNPYIYLSCTAEILMDQNLIPVEAVLPEGWGWSDLSIQGDGLSFWRSVDGDWWNVDVDVDEESQPEDSFSTVRAKRPTFPQTNSNPSVPSLMRQTLPSSMDMKMEDFSFELNGLEPQPALRSSLKRSITPTKKPLPALNKAKDRTDPLPGRLFDLYFTKSPALVGGVSATRKIEIQGTLVPLSSLMLVPEDKSIEIPFFRFDTSSSSHQLRISCPYEEERIMDTVEDSAGSISWNQDARPTFSPTEIRGPIKVSVKQNYLGSQIVQINFAWPKRKTEVGFRMNTRGRDVRILRASMSGSALKRLVKDEEVRIGKVASRGEGNVEVVLEVDDAEWETVGVCLPVLAGDGVMEVELKGAHWDAHLSSMDTNLTRTKDKSFTFPLSTTTPPFMRGKLSVTSEKKQSTRPLKTLFSFSTFTNLFILWLLVSMGQQVQRLRNEVAFVVDETRDLRMYGFGQPRNVETDKVEDTEVNDAVAAVPVVTEVSRNQEVALSTGGRDHGVARVVFGRTGWDRWFQHPTVKTLSRSVTWIWHAMIWLVVPG
ncbi:hypothetical protein P7C73_g5016, partial [Tremellales sp. Uapishka_1]